MYILALDVSSSRMGICEGRPGEAPVFGSVSFWREGQAHEDAYGRALEWAAVRFKSLAPERVVVEAPLAGGRKFHHSPETAYLLGGLVAVIAATAWCRNIQYRQYRVNTVRAHFIGNGNLPGDQAKAAVMRRCHQLGWKPNNDDEGDAGALWDYACAQVTKSVQMDLRLARAL